MQVLADSCERTEEDDDGPMAATEEGDSGSCMVLSGDADSSLLRARARLLARPTGLEGWKSLGYEKIAAGPQQPRSQVLRGERAGYVNNPPHLQS